MHQKAQKMDRKPVRFVGAALADLKDFPKNAMQDVGFQLDKISKGQDPDDFKAIPRVGRGAMELTQKIPDADIDIAKNRYKSI
mgnify:CR=1 FL=1